MTRRNQLRMKKKLTCWKENNRSHIRLFFCSNLISKRSDEVDAINEIVLLRSTKMRPCCVIPTLLCHQIGFRNDLTDIGQFIKMKRVYMFSFLDITSTIRNSNLWLISCISCFCLVDHWGVSEKLGEFRIGLICLREISIHFQQLIGIFCNCRILLSTAVMKLCTYPVCNSLTFIWNSFVFFTLDWNS